MPDYCCDWVVPFYEVAGVAFRPPTTFVPTMEVSGQSPSHEWPVMNAWWLEPGP